MYKALKEFNTLGWTARYNGTIGSQIHAWNHEDQGRVEKSATNEWRTSDGTRSGRVCNTQGKVQGIRQSSQNRINDFKTKFNALQDKVQL